MLLLCHAVVFQRSGTAVQVVAVITSTPCSWLNAAINAIIAIIEWLFDYTCAVIYLSLHVTPGSLTLAGSVLRTSNCGQLASRAVQQ